MALRSLEITKNTYFIDFLMNVLKYPQLIPDGISYYDPDKNTRAVGSGACKMATKLLFEQMKNMNIIQTKGCFFFFTNDNSNFFHDKDIINGFICFSIQCQKKNIELPYHFNPILLGKMLNLEITDKELEEIMNIIDKNLYDLVINNPDELPDNTSVHEYIRYCIDPEFDKNKINTLFIDCYNSGSSTQKSKKSYLQITKQISGNLSITSEILKNKIEFVNKCKTDPNFDLYKSMLLKYIESLSDDNSKKFDEWLSENNSSKNILISITDEDLLYYIQVSVCFSTATISTKIFNILDTNTPSSDMDNVKYKNMISIIESHYLQDTERSTMSDELNTSITLGEQIVIDLFLNLVALENYSVENNEDQNEENGIILEESDEVDISREKIIELLDLLESVLVNLDENLKKFIMDLTNTWRISCKLNDRFIKLKTIFEEMMLKMIQKINDNINFDAELESFVSITVIITINRYNKIRDEKDPSSLTKNDLNTLKESYLMIDSRKLAKTLEDKNYEELKNCIRLYNNQEELNNIVNFAIELGNYEILD